MHFQIIQEILKEFRNFEQFQNYVTKDIYVLCKI